MKKIINGKRELDRISLIISLLLFSFSILYGFFYFNRDMFSVPVTDHKLSESDKKDKDIEYSIKSFDAPYNYDLLDYRYLSSLSDIGELTIYDLDLNKVYENVDGIIDSGINHKLYKTTNSGGVIKVYFQDEKDFKSIGEIESNNYKKVYYNDNEEFFLIGFITNDEKEVFYKLDDDKVVTIESDGFNFIGDEDLETTMFTYDPDHIVIKKDDSKDFGVYDLNNKKISINTNYDFIKSSSKNRFIVYDDNNASIYDGNMKRLSITYDYIYRVFDYYIAIRDKRLIILDNDLKAVGSLDYTIDDSINDESKYTDIFSYYKYNDSLIFIDGHNKVIALNKDNKLFIGDIENLFFSNVLYYIKDSKLHIVDEELKDKYMININEYYPNNLEGLVKVNLYGNTLVISDYVDEYYFDFEKGTKIDSIEDYNTNITESIKIKVKRVKKEDDVYNSVTLTVGDESIKDLIIHDLNIDRLIKKINNNYYLFADNKIIRISKKG